MDEWKGEWRRLWINFSNFHDLNEARTWKKISEFHTKFLRLFWLEKLEILLKLIHEKRDERVKAEFRISDKAGFFCVRIATKWIKNMKYSFLLKKCFEELQKYFKKLFIDMISNIFESSFIFISYLDLCQRKFHKKSFTQREKLWREEKIIFLLFDKRYVYLT